MVNQQYLDSLRKRIREIDAQILELASERMEVCRQVGEYKTIHKLPVKDYKVEKLIIERIRQGAKDLKISPDLAESLMKQLIKFSVLEQEDIKTNDLSSQSDQEKNILIIGGSGNMGRWMTHFFETLSYTTRILDGKYSCDSAAYKDELAKGLLWADMIVLATPMVATNEVLKMIADLPTNGIIMEITSLKSPIMEGIKICTQAGKKLVSIHPMFGPDVKILAGRNILLCKNAEGDASSYEEVKNIFSLTSANIIELPLQQHDSYMSFVLGSAHLLNLVYANVLSESGLPLKELLDLAGTTFGKQLEVTSTVAKENQDLYFDIQSLNDETGNLLASFQTALDGFKQNIEKDDRDGFKGTMVKALNYFQTLENDS